MSKSVALVWFRRDLRLADQPALRAALDSFEAVVPVYVHAPEEEKPWEPGAASRWWLHHSLASLDDTLHRIGSRLIIRRGRTLPALLALVRETGASAVYWNRVYEPTLIERDTKVKTVLIAKGIQTESFNALLLQEPWDVVRADGAPYKVFTPFWKAGQALPQPAPPTRPPRMRSPAVWPRTEALESLHLRPRIPWDTGLAGAWTPGLFQADSFRIRSDP